MLKASKAYISVLIGFALMAIPAMVNAQDYYDDDIYTNAPKSKKEKKEKSNATMDEGVTVYSSQNGVYSPAVTVNFPGADTYYVNTGSTRNVDEYNRRGQFLVADTVIAEPEDADAYSNTRRIQRFHNSDIVNVMSDDDYVTYVNTDPMVVNVYVENNPWNTPYSTWNWRWRYGLPWYGGLSWGYYDPWLSWYDPWYNPWYSPVWGPSWSWGWSWGWGGPHWGGPGWGPGWGGPGWGPGGGIAMRPNTPAGSSRPHNYAGAGGSVRPVASTTSTRGQYGSSPTRPGNSGYGNPASSGSNRYSTPGRVGATSGSNSTVTSGSHNSGANYGTVSGTRGRNGASAAPAQSSGRQSAPSTTRSSSSSTRSSSTSSSSRSSSSSSSYGGSRGSSSTHSSGGYSGGSRGSGGYSGGGGSRGGGGRGR